MNNDRGRPGRGDVKGVVVDIDGTLSGANRRIGLDAIAALRQVNDSGIVVMLASGNVLPVAYSLAVYCGFEGPIIAENGGVVSHRQAVWKLAEPDVPIKAFEKLSRSMRVERLFTDRWRETEVGIKQEHDLEEVRRLVEGFDVDVQSTGWAIHIMRRGMDKMTGIQKACEIVGVEVSVATENVFNEHASLLSYSFATTLKVLFESLHRRERDFDGSERFLRH